ncbi:MAG TPA: metallophosphoesterase [Candidatus Sulfomarinibacteraceae bacterium]|nr:metallophosphoesterase [Candidatus Sulfomarinibacteraceae bacterium]
MRLLIFFVIVLAVWALMHAYVGWRLGTLPLFAAPGARRWLLAGLAIGFAAYPLGRILFNHGAPGLGRILEYGGAVWMGALVILIPALGLVDLVTLFGLILKPWVVGLRVAAVAVAALLSLVALVGGHARPRVVELELELPGLPAAADGLVIAQLSDLHLGSLIGAGTLKRVIDQIDGLAPDLVVITGDLVDGDAGAVEEMLPELARLGAPRGVYAVLGNHEYYAGEARSRALLRGAGFTVLDNAAAEIEPGLWLAGIADTAGGRQTGGLEGDLGAALAEVPEDAAVVLLQHTPGDEDQAAAAGVGLMLNGHTHGAQIWPAHYLVRLQFPHLAGVRRVQAMTQVVCRGAGRWGPPMRLFAPSEIYRIVLRTADRDNTQP